MNGGIYIHVPICRSRCRYCSFYSVSGGAEVDPVEFAGSLKNHLLSFEIPSDFRANSIYFGGGTPSLMPAAFFGEVVSAIREHIPVENEPEVTVEINPEDVSSNYLRSLKQVGINRISIGVQSTDNSLLRKLGRTHTAREAVSAIGTALTVFPNVSLDLIIGVEGESKDCTSILGTLPLEGLAHISLYMLDGAKNHSFAADADHTADLYMNLCDEFESRGLIQYEISNFSRKNRESVHNLHYWTGNPYIGLGPSAHSLLYPFRIWDHSGLKAFLRGDFRRDRMEYERTVFIREMIMLALRLRKGAKQTEFEKRYGIDLLGEFGWLCDRFPGFVARGREGISLSLEGMLVSNEIFQELIQ